VEDAQVPTQTLPTDRPTDPPTPTSAPEMTSMPLGYPGNPVTNNYQWTPVIDEFNGVQMALVPAGCFTMGSTEDEVNAALVLCEAAYGEGECKRDWFDDEQPTHKVCFDEPFWIDVYEVTNEQYGSSGEWSGDDLPREEVNWSDALAHCESREARLPTEAEWEYAARGPDSLIFPWGNTFDGSLVNFCDENCTEDWADKNVDDGYQNTAPVGSYPGGVSWVGVYDLSGNVWEWVNDWFGSDYYDSSPATNPQGPGSGEYRVMQGGSWYTNANSVRAALRGRENPSDRYLNLGFRCALSYEP
jgi:formylglycine-generating enzyme required for sulfatase activity